MSAAGGPELPREMAPGLHWLGSCLEVSPRIQGAGRTRSDGGGSIVLASNGVKPRPASLSGAHYLTAPEST